MAESKQDIFEKVARITAGKLKVEVARINKDSTLQDLGADSLDLVEIIMQLEEQFGIEIDDEKAEKLKSMNDVVEYVYTLRTK